MAVCWAQLRQLCGLEQAACPPRALWSVAFSTSLVLEPSLRGCAMITHEDAPGAGIYLSHTTALKRQAGLLFPFHR